MDEISRDQAIRNLINIEWGTIDSYKACKESLSEDAGEDLLDLLDECIADTYANIGNLETLLVETDTLADSLKAELTDDTTVEELIEEAEEEDAAEESIEDEVNEVGENDEEVVEVTPLSDEEEDELKKEIEERD